MDGWIDGKEREGKERNGVTRLPTRIQPRGAPVCLSNCICCAKLSDCLVRVLLCMCACVAVFVALCACVCVAMLLLLLLLFVLLLQRWLLAGGCRRVDRLFARFRFFLGIHVTLLVDRLPKKSETENEIFSFSCVSFIPTRDFWVLCRNNLNPI